MDCGSADKGREGGKRSRWRGENCGEWGIREWGTAFSAGPRPCSTNRAHGTSTPQLQNPQLIRRVSHSTAASALAFGIWKPPPFTERERERGGDLTLLSRPIRNSLQGCPDRGSSLLRLYEPNLSSLCVQGILVIFKISNYKTLKN